MRLWIGRARGGPLFTVFFLLSSQIQQLRVTSSTLFRSTLP